MNIKDLNDFQQQEFTETFYSIWRRELPNVPTDLDSDNPHPYGAPWLWADFEMVGDIEQSAESFFGDYNQEIFDHWVESLQDKVEA